MSTRGNDAFVERMLKVHPEIPFSGRSVIYAPEPVIPVQFVSDEAPKPSEPVISQVIHRDVLNISSKVGKLVEVEAQLEVARALDPTLSLTDTIIKVVSYLSKMRVSELKGIGRNKKFVYWRHLCWYVLLEHAPTATYSSIGRRFDRNHATVISGVRKVNRLFHVYEADIKLVEKLI